MESIHSSSAKAKHLQRRSTQAKRRLVHPFKRMCAGKSAAHHLSTFSPLAHAKRVGSYIDVQGEFPTASINAILLQHSKTLLFPTISDFKKGRMHFVRWSSKSRLKTNKFNIPEVFPNHVERDRQALDLVLVPLVGFDDHGNRLGMGGGFYDRYLASFGASNRPYALGVAYDLQRQTKIATEPWDYPLDAILTETGIQRFRR